MNNKPAPTFGYLYQTGFTLVEMAMVLMIVGLLLGGLIPTISSQIEQQRRNETRKTLEEIKEAMLGFAIATGRLPCPASASSNGQERFADSPTVGNETNGICSNFYNGFVPAATLGISPVDEQGYMLDGWNNRIRYAVVDYQPSGVINTTFTSADGMRNTTMEKIADSSTSLLNVCASSAGINGSDCGSTANKLTDKVPVVTYSTGKNGSYGGAGSDEAANLDGNRVFVSHTSTPSTATNGEFDDLMIWLSPNILFNRMVAAGKLP